MDRCLKWKKKKKKWEISCAIDKMLHLCHPFFSFWLLINRNDWQLNFINNSAISSFWLSQSVYGLYISIIFKKISSKNRWIASVLLLFEKKQTKKIKHYLHKTNNEVSTKFRLNFFTLQTDRCVTKSLHAIHVTDKRYFLFYSLSQLLLCIVNLYWEKKNT